MDIETLYEARIVGHAGLILDVQQDSGALFEKIAAWWPAGFEQPQLGVRQERGTFAALVKVGNLELPVWPLTTPEDALLSQMYFTMVAPIVLASSPNDLAKIAGLIREACHIHGVDVPEGFGSFCKRSALELVTPVEVMAADGLPVTTPVQTEASCRLFENNIDRWSAADQIVIATKLRKSAARHGVGWDHSYALDGGQVKIAESAAKYLDRRFEILSRAGAPELARYQHELVLLKEAAGKLVGPDELIKLATQLEDVDRHTGLSQLYDEHIPSAVDTLLVPYEADPIGQLEQALAEASAPQQHDWQRLNISKLASSGLCPDGVLEMLRQNPSHVMSQMDASIQQVFSEFIEA